MPDANVMGFPGVVDQASCAGAAALCPSPPLVRVAAVQSGTAWWNSHTAPRHAYFVYESAIPCTAIPRRIGSAGRGHRRTMFRVFVISEVGGVVRTGFSNVVVTG